MSQHTPASPPARIRQAIRALVLDGHDRVLLVRFEFPTATVWGLPGGGVEADEDPVTALSRELDEELGLVGATIGPAVWTRLHVVTFEHGGIRWDGQRDVVHLVRTASFEPRPRLSWSELRAERVHELRWWTHSEIAGSECRFAPRRLATFLERLVRDGPPDSPLDTGE